MSKKAPDFWSVDYRKTKLDGLRWSLQLTDQTLSGNNKLSLVFQESTQAGSNHAHPAYSDGTSIFINTDKVRDVISDRGVATVMGMNYHELAHMMYTWYQIMDVERALQESGRHLKRNFKDAYNILEEARVESLLAARYPRMEKYFTLAVSEFIVGNPDPNSFLILHGRKYIPKKIRDMYRGLFVSNFGEPHAVQAESLIDEYRTLVYSRDMKKAARIIHKFCELIPEDPAKAEYETPHGSTVRGAAGVPGTGPDQQRAEQDAEKAKEREENQGGENGPSGQDGGENSQGAGAQPGDDGDGDMDGDGAECSQSGGGSRGPRDNGAEKPQRGQAPGEGDGDGGKPPSLKEISKVFEELANDILQDAVIQADIQSARSSMNDTRNGMHSSLDRHPARSPDRMAYPVTDVMRKRAERYAEELRRIWLAMEPGWVYGASEGRLDMNRVFSASTPEEMEDVHISWDEGKQHNSKITVVFVGDESSSMDAIVMDEHGNNLGRRGMMSARNIWEIKTACKEVEAQVSVIMYDSSYRLLYDFDEDVDPNKYVFPCNGGGTSPGGAVFEARRILSQAETAGKVLVLSTDGEWPKEMAIEESLDSMEDVVKVCGLIGFPANKSWAYEKNFDIVRRTSGDLFGIVSEAVTHIMTRNLESW